MIRGILIGVLNFLRRHRTPPQSRSSRREFPRGYPFERLYVVPDKRRVPERETPAERVSIWSVGPGQMHTYLAIFSFIVILGFVAVIWQETKNGLEWGSPVERLLEIPIQTAPIMITAAGLSLVITEVVWNFWNWGRRIKQFLAQRLRATRR